MKYEQNKGLKKFTSLLDILPINNEIPVISNYENYNTEIEMAESFNDIDEICKPIVISKSLNKRPYYNNENYKSLEIEKNGSDYNSNLELLESNTDKYTSSPWLKMYNNMIDENQQNFEKLMELKEQIFKYEKSKCNSELADLLIKIALIFMKLNKTQYLTHVCGIYQKCIDLYTRDNNYKSLGDIYKNLSTMEEENENYSKAIDYLDKAINFYSHENKNLLGQCYYSKAVILQNTEQWTDSKNYFIKSFEFYKNEYSLEAANCCFKLGLINERLNSKDSKDYYVKALNIYNVLYGENNLKSGSVCYNLGNLLEILEKIPEAIEYYLKANIIYKNSDQTDDYIYTLVKVGTLNLSLGNKNEGVEFLEEALQIITNNKNEDNNKNVREEDLVSIVELSLPLSSIYLERKNFEESANCILRVCMYMPQEKDYIDKVYEILIILLEQTTNNSSYVRTLDESIKFFIAKLTSEKNLNCSFINVSNNISSNSIGLGLSEISNTVNSDSNNLYLFTPLKIAEMLTKIANFLIKIGLQNRGINYFIKSISFYEKCEQDKNIKNKLIETNNSLGIEFNKIKDHQNSFKYFHKVLNMRIAISGNDHLKTAAALNNLAIAYDKLDNHDEAIKCWKKCMEIRLKILPSNDIKIGNTYFNLSLLLAKTNKIEDAIMNMLKALHIYEFNYQSNSSYSAECNLLLGEYHKILGNFNESLTYLKHVITALNNLHSKEAYSLNLKANILTGICLSKTKQYQKSLDLLYPILESIRKNKSDFNEILYEAWWEMGSCYEANNDYEKSLMAFHYLKMIMTEANRSEKEISEIENKIFQVKCLIETSRYKLYNK